MISRPKLRDFELHAHICVRNYRSYTVFFSVQDYLINIKANRGDCVKRLMCDMIQLLLILGDNYDYARAVILHVRALMYHEENPELPFHDMFTNDVGTLVRKPGKLPSR